MITEFVDWLPGTMGHTPRWGQPWAAEDYRRRERDYVGMARRRRSAARFHTETERNPISGVRMAHSAIVCDALADLARRYAGRVACVR